MAAGILFAAIYDRPVHIAHISLKEEVLLIKAAKERGIKVTCEVCPHHLFLTADSPLPQGEGPGRRAEPVEAVRVNGRKKSARASPQKKMLMPYGKIWM